MRRTNLLPLVALLVLLVLPSAAQAGAWETVGATSGSPTGLELTAPMSTTVLPNGNLLVADVTSARLVEVTQAGSFVREWVTDPAVRATILGTIDVEAAPDGTVWVASILRGKVLQIASDGTVLSSFDTGGMPYGVLPEAGGTVLVADWASGVVTRRDSSGAIVTTFLSQGGGAGQTLAPLDLTLDPTDGTIWITDDQRNAVINVASDGTFLAEFALLDPWALDVAADGRLYVTNGSGELWRYERDGTPVDEISSPAASFTVPVGEHIWATDIDIVGDGTLFLTDGAIGRLTHFAPAGTVLGSIGVDLPRPGSHRLLMQAVDDGAGGIVATDGEQAGIVRHSAGGAMSRVAGAFASPIALFNMFPRFVVRRGSETWYGDGSTGHIRRLLPGDVPGPAIGSLGAGPGQFDSLGGFDVAGDGSVFVLDHQGAEVVRLAADGSELDRWGSPGAAEGQLDGPTAIDIAPDGNIWILDANTPRMQVFAPDGTHLRTLDWDNEPTPAAMLFPPSMELSPDGRSVATTSLSCRCVRVIDTTTGTQVSSFDGTVQGQDLLGPMDVSWAADDEVVVAEMFSSRVSRWRYDGTAPTASFAATGAFGSITFTASASDAGFGLANLAYSWDGGATWTADTTRTISGLGPGEARSQSLQVRDRAGNVATTSATGTSLVDTTPPKLPGIATRLPHKAVVGGSATLKLGGNDPETGVTQYIVTFRGRQISIAGDVLAFRLLPEGYGLIRIVATNGAGLGAVYERYITVDRTPPVLRTRVPRFVLGPTLTLRQHDTRSGSSNVRIGKLRLGTNRRTVSLRDASGNVRRTVVRVQRRLSLSRPLLNRDLTDELGIRHTPSVNGTVFGFDSPQATWYHDTDVAPVLVREVQWRLQRWGYLSRAMRRTGELDIATIQAVKRFQRAEGLPAIATVGPRTRAALDRRLLAER